MQRHNGFTLVEIMIVVSIIALLAVLVVPAVLRARQSAQNAKVANSLRVATSAIEMYAVENGGKYPPDTTRGVVPSGLATYLDATMNWTGPTPIGGLWDWDFNVFGVTAAVSIAQPAANTAQLREIDQRVDDGNLNSGQMQVLGTTASPRFSAIVED